MEQNFSLKDLSSQEGIQKLPEVRSAILDAEKFIESTLESAPSAWVGAFNNALVVIIGKLFDAVKDQKLTLTEFGKYEERVVNISAEVHLKVVGMSPENADQVFSDEDRKQWIGELEHILD